MIAFLDTSFFLRYILLGDIAMEHALSYEHVAASELLWLESMRVLDRHRLESQLDDIGLVEAKRRATIFYGGINHIQINPQVLSRAAEAFPTVIGTLDAIHLASLLIYQKKLSLGTTLFSYDRQLNLCAQALGINTACN